MTVSKRILRLVVLAIAGLLCSCIDSREEYWLQADGSGRAEISCNIPAAAAARSGGESGIRKMLAGFLRQTPEMKGAGFEVSTEQDRVRVKINFGFDSALDLKDLASKSHLKTLPSAASHLAGEIETKLNGLSLDFSRKITASKALPGLAFLPDSQLEGHRMIYIMHLPSVPLESNATRVEDAGRTLVWEIPLARAIKAPIVTHFIIPVPIPWRFLPVIAVPVSLVAFGFILLRIRKLKNRFSSGSRGNPVL